MDNAIAEFDDFEEEDLGGDRPEKVYPYCRCREGFY